MPAYGKRTRARNRDRLSERQLDLFDPADNPSPPMSRAARRIQSAFGLPPHVASLTAALAGFTTEMHP